MEKRVERWEDVKAKKLRQKVQDVGRCQMRKKWNKKAFFLFQVTIDILIYAKVLIVCECRKCKCLNV